MENRLMKEMPVSEMVATLELFARHGVTREDLTMLRANPVYANHIATELKGVRKIRVQHGWNHYDGEDAFAAFTQWMDTYNSLLIYTGRKKNFFVGFRALISFHGAVTESRSYEQKLPFAIISEATYQMATWPDAVKKSGYALPIRKIAALMSGAPDIPTLITQRFHFDPKEFAVSLGGSDPRLAWTVEHQRLFATAVLRTLS